MQPGAVFTPAPGADSVEAARFKSALRDVRCHAGRQLGAPPARAAADLDGVAADAFAALHPSRTIPRRVMAGIFVPPHMQKEIGDEFVEPMAYPVIDTPMFDPLENLSPELFLPNINLIAPNSVTLLETNRPFIEAYMVGLNHEFARELLWREYPTDQRGSTFRQFWDVRSFFDVNPDSPSLREKLRDILPLHRWPIDSVLGSHDNRRGQRERRRAGARDSGRAAEALSDRRHLRASRLLAAERRWDGGGPGEAPVREKRRHRQHRERRLAPLTASEESAPPRTKVLTPMFEAKVDPDIYFLGFDLTAEGARGGSGERPDDDPGWFFVIKERPGEPRFGLDSEAAAAEGLERPLVERRAARGGGQLHRDRNRLRQRFPSWRRVRKTKRRRSSIRMIARSCGAAT